MYVNYYRQFLHINISFQVKRNQVLLDLAGVIFQEQSTIDNTIHRILTHMLSLIRCERAMLLLVHDTSQGTFSRVFDLDQVYQTFTSMGPNFFLGQIKKIILKENFTFQKQCQSHLNSVNVCNMLYKQSLLFLIQNDSNILGLSVHCILS